MGTPMVRREEKEAPQVGWEELSIGAGECMRSTPTRAPARPRPRDASSAPAPRRTRLPRIKPDEPHAPRIKTRPGYQERRSVSSKLLPHVA